ncbi:MAG: BON domain-containing protein [Gemmatimonadales bacterium]
MRLAASAASVGLCALVLLGAAGNQSSTDAVRAAGTGQDVESPNPQVETIRADASMTVLVQTALMRDLRFRGRRLGVEVLAGVVTLRGKVDSSESKASAAEIARSVSGVKGIRNELQVVPPAERAEVDARDREIGRAIDDRIKRDAQLGTEQIGVRVDAGLVTLTGEVRNPGFSARAMVIARAVPGVRAVSNELDFLPLSAVSPAQGQAPRHIRPRPVE